MNTNETQQTTEGNGEAANPEKYNYKLTDEEFMVIFKENYGLYSKTAKAIEEKYGISFTRQSAWERYHSLSRQLDDQKQLMIDEAISMVFKSITQNGDLKTKLKASMYLLNKLPMELKK